MVDVHNFSGGLLTPLLAYFVSCLGAFLGLQCVTRAGYHQGRARAGWLAVAAAAIGATGIWAMHFIAMLGFAVPGQRITYNIPVTIASMLIAIAVVAIGLFIVSFGHGGPVPLLAGGLIVGFGVAGMHYLGMAAMVMPDTMSYNVPLFIASIAIAVFAGTAALWIGTWVSGLRATLGASLVMGVAVSGMHYTGMAAMHLHPGMMSGMSGVSGESFLLPLLLGLTLATFLVALMIGLAPTQAEIMADAEFRRQMQDLQHAERPRLRPAGTHPPAVRRAGR